MKATYAEPTTNKALLHSAKTTYTPVTSYTGWFCVST